MAATCASAWKVSLRIRASTIPGATSIVRPPGRLRVQRCRDFAPTSPWGLEGHCRGLSLHVYHQYRGPSPDLPGRGTGHPESRLREDRPHDEQHAGPDGGRVYACSKAALDKLFHELAMQTTGTGGIVSLTDPGWLRRIWGGPRAALHNPKSALSGELLGPFWMPMSMATSFRPRTMRASAWPGPQEMRAKA